ncbi:tRNA (guanine-N(7)-)-methyltransferase subunit WDR4-like, partial [Tropilaelaps mercedesae]
QSLPRRISGIHQNHGHANLAELIVPPLGPNSVQRTIGEKNKNKNGETGDMEEPRVNEETVCSQVNHEEVKKISDGHENSTTKKGDTSAELVRLTSVYVSRCQTYVLACTSDKRLVVWMRKNNDGDVTQGDQWVLHSVRDTPRKCVQVRVTGQVPPMILVADRAGDVYEFPLDDPNVAPNLLMGRMSMLLDMALSPSDDFIVVCDRDEKIVVCHYPEAYEIIAFCLGHRQFVTSIELLPYHLNRLVSVGGDGRLILWDLETGGVPMESADCWAEAQAVEQLLPFEQFYSRKEDQDIRPPLKKVLCKRNLIAVVYCRVPYIHIFRCDGSSLVTCGGVAVDTAVWSAAIDDSLRLWVLTPSVSIFQLSESGTHQSVKLSTDLSLAMNRALSPLEGVSEIDPDLDILYKQRFGNVEGYLERKQQREEFKKQRKGYTL